MDSIFWIIMAVVFAAVEFGTVALISVWFVGGAIAALIASLLGAKIWLQVLIFAGVSAVLLLLVRPFLRKYVDPHKVKTNVDALVGQKAVVIEPIDNLEGLGTVKLNGNIWTARSVDEETIPADTVVEIRSIEGVKLMVAPVDSPAK